MLIICLYYMFNADARLALVATYLVYKFNVSTSRNILLGQKIELNFRLGWIKTRARLFKTNDVVS